jgi:hypothetical protein
MNLDVAAGTYPQFSRTLSVRRLWVGKGTGAMKCAVGIFPINRLNSFRRIGVALPIFLADGLSAQCDFVCFQRFIAAQQRQSALGLSHDDFVCMLCCAGLSE